VPESGAWKSGAEKSAYIPIRWARGPEIHTALHSSAHVDLTRTYVRSSPEFR
jgi:hypothetical protein